MSKTERVHFLSANRRTFVWVESQKEILLVARGKVADEATTLPETRIFSSPAAAAREREELTAQLLEEGFLITPAKVG